MRRSLFSPPRWTPAAVGQLTLLILPPCQDLHEDTGEEEDRGVSTYSGAGPQHHGHQAGVGQLPPGQELHEDRRWIVESLLKKSKSK